MNGTNSSTFLPKDDESVESGLYFRGGEEDWRLWFLVVRHDADERDGHQNLLCAVFLTK